MSDIIDFKEKKKAATCRKISEAIRERDEQLRLAGLDDLVEYIDTLTSEDANGVYPVLSEIIDALVGQHLRCLSRDPDITQANLNAYGKQLVDALSGALKEAADVRKCVVGDKKKLPTKAEVAAMTNDDLFAAGKESGPCLAVLEEMVRRNETGDSEVYTKISDLMFTHAWDQPL